MLLLEWVRQLYTFKNFYKKVEKSLQKYKVLLPTNNIKFLLYLLVYPQFKSLQKIMCYAKNNTEKIGGACGWRKLHSL